MIILVTGGAGFIGSAVVRLAIARGHSVVNVDALTYAACLDNLASVAEHTNYAFEQVDIRNRAVLDAVFTKYAPDAVMHLAAESHVDRSIDGPTDFIETNVMVPLICLRQRVAIGSRRESQSLFGFTTSARTKCSDRWVPQECSPRIRHTTRAAPILRLKPVLIIWYVRGVRLTACRCC